MAEIRSLCVFCGSTDGLGTGYARLAREIGRNMASKGVRLVYGGGSIGTMGHMARSALAAGGEVVGVIPSHLDDKEVAFEGCTELHVVTNMHKRKTMMFDLADGFLVLPGGLGTMEMLVEILTWKQMRLHEKPTVLLDQNGFWKPLRIMFQQMINQKFANPNILKMFYVANNSEEIFDLLEKADDPWLESESNLF